MTHQTKGGFTLIELLIVIAIIAILLAVGTTSYLTASKQSRDSRRKTDLEQIRQALEMYRSENGTYPAQGAGNTPSGLTPTYITTLPADPKEGTYYYAVGSPATTYSLCATLEIVPVSPVSGCGTDNNYKVQNP